MPLGRGTTATGDGVKVIRIDAKEDEGELTALWSDGTVLRVRKTNDADGESDAWCRNIADGLLLEVSAPMEDSGAAELTVKLCDVADEDHWYGGSHLLKQLWPLERAKIEMGPFYPFDHGPNGVGNVLGCLLYTSPSPRDQRGSRMPSSA